MGRARKDDKLVEAVDRPWGTYINIFSDEKCKIKKIIVKPRMAISLQKHEKRSEHWYIISGSGIITLGEESFSAEPGQSFDIPVGTIHRIRAGKEKLCFIEVQTGSYFGEDDIIRLSDDFGRS